MHGGRLAPRKVKTTALYSRPALFAALADYMYYMLAPITPLARTDVSKDYNEGLQGRTTRKDYKGYEQGYCEPSPRAED